MFNLSMQVPRRIVAIAIAICLFWQPFALADATPKTGQDVSPYLQQAIARVTEFRLDNGMRFIVMENHDAPVVSFVTYADVGGVNEPVGKTGVAHFLEHLAFKGTDRIGTKDYAAEKQSLDRLDTAFLALKSAREKGKTAEIPKLEKAFNEAQSAAQTYVIPNEFGQIVERAGGDDINAATSADATQYFYSFPSNKLELWMSLESERFLKPVFREFYKEQQVILEERRLRTDNNPIGKMIEMFLDKAYTTHPYKRPVIGYDKDIRNLDREDVQAFFNTHYVPSNLTVAIVGDVNPQQVKQLAETYFGRYPARPKPSEAIAVEPKQTVGREVTLEFESQPWYLEGYHRPALNHPDNAIYEAIASLMSDGRTSRLYQSLVEKQRLALAAEGENGFPGDKYPNLMLFYAQTAPNVSIDAVAKALRAEIERLKTEPVTPTELERVKNQLRAGLLRSLDSNLGMAQSLVDYEVKTGSWRNLFTEIDAIAAVTPEDIQRVAKQTFTPENRTIGKIVPPAAKN